MSKTEPEILFTDEAAALVRKSVATMQWLRATGQGPRSGKLGRRVVYRRSDVEAWIAAAFEGGAA
ncbi:MAG: helix-turn-helix domain-containing protein [Mycobacterium sp.]|uniref:helix-turn-helix transcriptional regulator n=1 Tax=Mycobacterium sp. TaxID=1785 RepID=UPI003C60EC82